MVGSVSQVKPSGEPSGTVIFNYNAQGAGLLYGGEDGVDVLFAMGEVDADAIFLVEVLGEVLSTIDGAVLTTRATEGEHQVGEAALEVTLDVVVGQTINAVKEGEDLAVVLEELDDGSLQAVELLVRFVATGIMRGTTVEDVASAVAAAVLGDAALVGEGEDANG